MKQTLIKFSIAALTLWVYHLVSGQKIGLISGVIATIVAHAIYNYFEEKISNIILLQNGMAFLGIIGIVWIVQLTIVRYPFVGAGILLLTIVILYFKVYKPR